MKLIERILTYGFVLKPRVVNDDRGYFFVSLREKIFKILTIIKVILR